MNALKILEKERDTLPKTRAHVEMFKLWDGGIQVEYLEFDSFLAWMIYQELATASGPVCLQVWPL